LRRAHAAAQGSVRLSGRGLRGSTYDRGLPVRCHGRSTTRSLRPAHLSRNAHTTPSSHPSSGNRADSSRPFRQAASRAMHRCRWIESCTERCSTGAAPRTRLSAHPTLRRERSSIQCLNSQSLVPSSATLPKLRDEMVRLLRPRIVVRRPQLMRGSVGDGSPGRARDPVETTGHLG
jgi:hypothetical protein